MAVLPWKLDFLLLLILIGIVNGFPYSSKKVNRSHSNHSEPELRTESPSVRKTMESESRFPSIPKTPAKIETSIKVYESFNINTAIKRRKKKASALDIMTTIITVINATPYRWRRGYIHSYQIADWDSDWPEYIESGRSFQMTSFRFKNVINIQDSAAEVVYHLEDTRRPASFMLGRRRGKKYHVFVKFLENLKTTSLGKDSEIIIDYHPHPGGSQFLLAGWEGEFISVDPPRGWMRDSLDDIGNYTLKEIVLPRSHHAGMNTAKGAFGVARPINTLTQTKKVSEQIEKFGIRVLDLRPAKHKGNFRASHGSTVLGLWNGMLGESVKDIAKAIGKFHQKYPGEIIIVDIPSDGSGKVDSRWQALNVQDILELCQIFIDHAKPLVLPQDTDITKLSLHRLIGGGIKDENSESTGGTIVRIDHEWAINRMLPGPENGFISSKNLPLSHRWSDKNRADIVAADQIKAIKHDRPTRKSRLFFSDWIATQTTLEAVFPVDSITKMALPMYNVLYDELWNLTTDNMYPNWIAMDHIHSTELVAFVRMLNRCMVARRCGSLGGKVPVPAKPIVKNKIRG